MAAQLPETRPAQAGRTPLTRTTAPRLPAKAANGANPPAELWSLRAAGTTHRVLAAPAMITPGLAVIILRGRPGNCLRDGVVRRG